MTEIIFKFLTKRHKVEGITVYCIDDNPPHMVALFFSIKYDEALEYFHRWIESVISSEKVILKFSDGQAETFLNHTHQLHSFDDEPAIRYPDGQMEWFHEGNRHRDNGPAVITARGYEYFFKHGVKQIIN